jgi:hypothetical protein
MMIRFPEDETTRPIVATIRSHLSGHASEHILRQSRPLPVLVLPAEAGAGVPPSISAALDSLKIRVSSPSAFGATLLARDKDALFDPSILKSTFLLIIDSHPTKTFRSERKEKDFQILSVTSATTIKGKTIFMSFGTMRLNGKVGVALGACLVLAATWGRSPTPTTDLELIAAVPRGARIRASAMRQRMIHIVPGQRLAGGTETYPYWEREYTGDPEAFADVSYSAL